MYTGICFTSKSEKVWTCVAKRVGASFFHARDNNNNTNNNSLSKYLKLIFIIFFTLSKWNEQPPLQHNSLLWRCHFKHSFMNNITAFCNQENIFNTFFVWKLNPVLSDSLYKVLMCPVKIQSLFFFCLCHMDEENVNPGSLPEVGFSHMILLLPPWNLLQWVRTLEV